MKIKLLFVLIIFLSFSSLGMGQSQTPQGSFPEGKFYGEFYKHLEHDIFRPFYAWEGRMGMDFAVFRKSRHAVFYKNEFLTVGGRVTHNRINIVGTSYLMEGRYQFDFSEILSFGGGMAHNSSHLTQDLADLVWQEIMGGKRIPQIDTSDLNVVFGEVKWKSIFPKGAYVVLRIQPANFKGLRSGSSWYERPVYIAAENPLWQGKEKRIVVATQHELGNGGFSDYSARLELFAKSQEEGRLQFLVGGSPGSSLHTSSNYPWYKDGLRIGIRVVFDAK